MIQMMQLSAVKKMEKKIKKIIKKMTKIKMITKKIIALMKEIKIMKNQKNLQRKVVTNNKTKIINNSSMLRGNMIQRSEMIWKKMMETTGVEHTNKIRKYIMKIMQKENLKMMSIRSALIQNRDSVSLTKCARTNRSSKLSNTELTNLLSPTFLCLRMEKTNFIL